MKVIIVGRIEGNSRGPQHRAEREHEDPNVLSAPHLVRIKGGLLYALSSNVPWATLLARTFDVDAHGCARCGGRLEVRAVITDTDVARRILDAFPTTARAPPVIDAPVRFEPAFA